MLKYEDRCLGCTDMGMRCLGRGCPNKNVPVYYCDKRGEELDAVYVDDGEHLCEQCLLEKHIMKE